MLLFSVYVALCSNRSLSDLLHSQGSAFILFRLKRILFHCFDQSGLPIFAFCIFWMFGLSAGVYTASTLPLSILSLVRTILYDRTSVILLILIRCFPLFAAFIVCLLYRPVLVIPIAFIKAFSFAFSAYGIVLAFGNAGWLIRWLLMFSDSISILFFVWFSIRNISNNQKSLIKDFVVCFLATTFFCISDYFAILPLSMSFFNY